MTKIKMQEENCDYIHGRMEVGARTLQENLTNVAMASVDLISTGWYSPSAEEFLREFSTLAKEMQAEIDKLQQLTGQFGQAIQDFKEVNAKFG